jgi:uncharacterized protein YerC
MPHVSTRTLQRKTFKHISKDLTVLIASLRSKNEIKTFLGELLTPTERVMLTKRLAIIFMLKKDYSFEIIWRTLHVSPSTVARFWKETKRHSYPTISKQIKNEKAREEFWNSLEHTLLAGMPPMNPTQAKRLFPYKRKHGRGY